MTRRPIVTCLVSGLLILSGPLAHSAEIVSGPATQTELDNAIAKTLVREDAARSTISTLLRRDDVRRLAAGHGLDIRRAEAAVGTLQGAELQRLSLLATDAERQLAGGDHVIRISLIAALLIVIIIILIAR